MFHIIMFHDFVHHIFRPLGILYVIFQLITQRICPGGKVNHNSWFIFVKGCCQCLLIHNIPLMPVFVLIGLRGISLVVINKTVGFFLK